MVEYVIRHVDGVNSGPGDGVVCTFPHHVPQEVAINIVLSGVRDYSSGYFHSLYSFLSLPKKFFVHKSQQIQSILV